MRGRYGILLLALLLAFVPQRGASEKIGLVLSGGGAKGIAHAGVIKALEENGIPIDYVAGTSMGAIVGGFYSCGYSPEEMMKLFTSPGFSDWSTGTVNPELRYYFAADRPTPELVRVNASVKKDSVSLIQSNLYKGYIINPIPMNIEFVNLFAPYQVQCGSDFNRLFVPFRCVYSDVYNKHKVVCRSGSLPDAIRASMSFPMVFKPIEMEGVLAYDGGIYDNFPVDVMEEDFHPDFIIGVSVSRPDGKPKPGNAYSQLEDLIIQNNDYSLPAEEGIKIQVPVTQFAVLDFPKAKEIYDIGYRTGLEMIDSIKSRISSRRDYQELKARRAGFKAATPSLRFDSVSVSGATPKESEFIRYQFLNGGQKDFGTGRMIDSYYNVVSYNKVSDLVPTALPLAGDTCALALKADIKKNLYAGFGGWITSSPNTMGYLRLGYSTLDFSSLDVSLSGWIGQSYMAGLFDVTYRLRTPVPSRIELNAVMSRKKLHNQQHFFFHGEDSPSIVTHENFVRAGYEVAAGQSAKVSAGIGYGYRRYDYYSLTDPEYLMQPKDKSQYRIWALSLGYDFNTLNSKMYPDKGRRFKAIVEGYSQASRFLPHGKDSGEKYHSAPQARIEVSWKHFFPLKDNVSFGISADGAATFGKLTENYVATLIGSPEFSPFPSLVSVFNPDYRSRNYVAAGVTPVWNPFAKFQLRGDMYCFVPVRKLASDEATGKAKWDGWFPRASFMGEVTAVYNFPFASLAIYCNYLSSPSSSWNFGISFGLLFEAPRFLR